MSSRFQVGQRVRIKYVENECNKSLTGKEGTVTQIKETKDEVVLYGLDIFPLVPQGMFVVGLTREQLEPATYDDLLFDRREGATRRDGNDLVEWNETLWQPETEAVL